MDARASLQTLLDLFGRRSGLGRLGFDATGVCALRLGGAVIHLFAEPGGDTALFYVPLGPVKGGTCRAMLEANFPGSAGFLALDPRSGEAILVARPLLAGLSPPGFEQLLADLATQAERWRTELTETGGATEPLPELSHAAFAFPMIRG